MIETIQKIIEEQNATFIRRSEEIRYAWLAALAGEHIFYLGKPGIAKSMLAEDMTRRVKGANYFRRLLRKETKMEEIFGPLSLRALRDEDRLHYNTKGFLAESHFAFLDEIFKSSSAVLNGLLTGLNERLFDNGDTMQKMPLITVFSASNELPQGEELSALFDRFLIRFHVRGLEDDDDFRELLVKRPTLTAGTQIDLAAFLDLQKKVREVVIPAEIVDKIVELRSGIVSGGLWASDRRWMQSLKIVQANAVLDGRTEAAEDDLEVFKNILWDDLAGEKQVARIVLGTINPLNVKFLELLDAAEEQYRDVKKEIERGGDNVQALALQAQVEIKGVQDALKEMARGLSDGTMKERIKEGYKQVREYNKYVTKRGLGVGSDDDEL